MSQRADLARKALARALRVRQDAGREIWQPLCVYDLAHDMGVEVRFVDAPSMEGVYYNPGRPTALVTAHRPPGRQAFTCAHELGHHCFGHANVVDEMVGEEQDEQIFDADEFSADCFAGFLLMPKIAVCQAFASRGWDPSRPTAEQAYVVAGQLGVSYGGLIHHLRSSLRLLAPRPADELLKVQPKDLRTRILGDPVDEGLVVVDRSWWGRAIDVQVGELILAPEGADVEGTCAEALGRHPRGILFRASTPGQGRLHDGAGWGAFVRVSRRGYLGRAVYRHLEDPDYV